MKPTVRKAVIPAAGIGTRFLPITKTIPKEMLPVGDRPVLHYVVEEAVEAGIEEIIVITGHGKGSMQDYFSPNPGLEEFLASKGYEAWLQQVQALNSMARFTFLRQEKPLGLGHAVLCAHKAVGNEPFLVMLPDDLYRASPGVSAQLIGVQEQHGGSVIGVARVPWEEVQSKGVIKAATINERLSRVEAMVEKPSRDKAPSNLAIVGRYVLSPEVFSCLERTNPGAKGEIQLTDGLALLLEKEPIYAYAYEGVWLDCGTPQGLLVASLDFMARRKDVGATVVKMAKAVLRSVEHETRRS